MANAVSYNSYRLKGGVSISDFLLSTNTLINEFASKQKGWISSKTLVDGDIWADFTVFETIDDLEAFVPLCSKSNLAKKCWSYMDLNTLKSHRFLVERDY